MLRLSLFSLLLMFFFIGCSTVQVKTDFNPGTDFSGLKTYRWLGAQDDPGNDVRINSELVVKTVQIAVDNELMAKGFVKDDSGQPDFVVTWFGSIDKKIRSESMNHFYRPYGYGTLYRDPYWNSQPTTMNTVEYEQGSLIIDVLDPGRQTLLWRGFGSSRLKQNQSTSQVTNNLNSAIRRILTDFPPH